MNRPRSPRMDELVRVLQPLVEGGREDFSPHFVGSGQSRDLLTQSGQSAALLQESEMREGNVYTVVFGVIPPGDGVPFSAVATLRWSENGNVVLRQVSVANGRSVSCPGRIVDVRVTDTTPTTLPVSGDPTPGPGSVYTVTAVVERGTRAAEHQPPVLEAGFFDLVQTGDTATLEIPRRSGVLSVCVLLGGPVASAASAEVLGSFTSDTGIFGQQVWLAGQTPTGTFIPVPSGATDLQLTNLLTGDEPEVYVWVLWGIDG